MKESINLSTSHNTPKRSTNKFKRSITSDKTKNKYTSNNKYQSSDNFDKSRSNNKSKFSKDIGKRNTARNNRRPNDRNSIHKTARDFHPGTIKNMLLATKHRVKKTNYNEDEFDEYLNKNSPSQIETTTNDAKNINPEPILVAEKDTWKGKPLNKLSLIHLLTLELIYSDRVLGNAKYGDSNESTTNKMTQRKMCFQWIVEQELFLQQEISDSFSALVIEQIELIDREEELSIQEISPFLIGWQWERLPLLRQLILLTSWVLIKHTPAINVKIILNDAINHAKWFGDAHDQSFINSILDKLITEKKLWS